MQSDFGPICVGQIQLRFSRAKTCELLNRRATPRRGPPSLAQAARPVAVGASSQVRHRFRAWLATHAPFGARPEPLVACRQFASHSTPGLPVLWRSAHQWCQLNRNHFCKLVAVALRSALPSVAWRWRSSTARRARAPTGRVRPAQPGGRVGQPPGYRGLPHTSTLGVAQTIGRIRLRAQFCNADNTRARSAGAM